MHQPLATRGDQHAGTKFVLIVIAVALLCTASIIALDRLLADTVRAFNDVRALAGAKNATIFKLPLLLLFGVGLVHQYTMEGLENRLRANRVLLLTLSVIAAVFCAALFQLVFGRVKVEDYLSSGTYGFHYFHGSLDNSSFPSTFSAAVGAVAATYWMVMPIFRPTIALLSVLGIASEIADETHFLSDAVAGFTIGVLAFLSLKKLMSVLGFQLEELRGTKESARLKGRRE
jgi:membrane-associated phospholipid phosphatase